MGTEPDANRNAKRALARMASEGVELMYLSWIRRFLVQQRVPVEVSTLVLLFMSSVSTASTGPSWSQQPSWASESPIRKNTAALQDSRYASPFSPGSNNISLDVGQVFLMGSLGNSYSDNIGAQLHYTYGVSDLFGFDASLGYSDHTPSDLKEGAFSMTTLLTGLRTNMAWYDKVVFHMIFGMGFYRPSYQQLLVPGEGGKSATATVSPVLFGVHMGPGVDLELTRQLFFGAGIRFHDVFGTSKLGPTGTPVDVGGTFTTFLIHAGVTF